MLFVYVTTHLLQTKADTITVALHCPVGTYRVTQL